MYIDDPLKREFYIEMRKMNNGDSRTLSGRIKSMLCERTAIAKKPDEVIANDLEQLRKEGDWKSKQKMCRASMESSRRLFTATVYNLRASPLR